MYESDDQQSKREFYYHQSNNNKKNNIENGDSMSRYTYVRYVKKPYYDKPLINLDRLVITGKYQTSVFYVRRSPYGLGPYCQDLDFIFSRNYTGIISWFF